MSGLHLVAVSVVALVFAVANVGVFAWRVRRRRVFTRGLRGTAVVVGVRPAALYQRKALLEAPTEVVAVATAAVPGGVETNQKLPAGQYVVGQMVNVVQCPGYPHQIFVDRPDLEPSVPTVYGPLVMAVAAPFIVLLAAACPPA